MLIVSSLEGVRTAFATHRPKCVISLLSEDDAVPSFKTLDPAKHLKLYVERESCAATISAAAKERAREIVAFVRDWDRREDVLIHCNRGVSRSTAAAFIIMCMSAPDISEATLAAALRRAAPFADPCPMLVSYADDILDRKGRMIDAIEALPPPAPAISAPIVTLPLTA
ncbi:MAG: hypothetical protein GC153_09010 [Alphaproteobacteria bacterium]|nr:hypothetical protein [Alphaproteobacteria bacterium]